MFGRSATCVRARVCTLRTRSECDRVAQLVLLTFPMNLIGCGLNDIYDYESDRLSTRRRKIWAADVTPETRPFVYAGLLGDDAACGFGFSPDAESR